ncbi:MAG TPA: class I SAM-dependent methyltransferase [Polyangiaceae bacterium]|nr:class I SAM-dependent methyltransferase [Polyangiaceae bacterium]
MADASPPAAQTEILARLESLIGEDAARLAELSWSALLLSEGISGGVSERTPDEASDGSSERSSGKYPGGSPEGELELAPSAATLEHLLLHRRLLADWLARSEASELSRGVESTQPALAGRPSFAAQPDRYLAERCARWLSYKNQFAFGADTQPELFRLFADGRTKLASALSAPADLVEARVRAAWAEVRGALSRWAKQRAGAHPRAVVCSEYSASLQLEVLGLDLESLAEPILDVGCGERAELVTLLKARGKRVVGLDRYAQKEGCLVADWLAFPYESARWGTVLSHQAFTLHFAHQHLANAELSRSYAATYMRILRSLAPRGRFAYAPSLPFLEELLPPSEFSVTRRSILAATSPAKPAAIEELERKSGVALQSSTLVQRSP